MKIDLGQFKPQITIISHHHSSDCSFCGSTRNSHMKSRIMPWGHYQTLHVSRAWAPDQSTKKHYLGHCMYKTNRFHFVLDVYCDNAQRASKRSKNNRHQTVAHSIQWNSALWTPTWYGQSLITYSCVCPMKNNGK